MGQTVRSRPDLDRPRYRGLNGPTICPTIHHDRQDFPCYPVSHDGIANRSLPMLLLVFAGAFVPATESFADPDCRCRADGRYFELGDVACIGGATNRRLAQCVMVLNNTSWTILEDQCPQARLDLRQGPQSTMSEAVASGGTTSWATTPGSISSGRRISLSSAARGS